MESVCFTTRIEDATSALVLAALTLGAQSATSTIPDGSRLALGQHCYTINAPKPVGVTCQSVSREQVHGVDARAIVVHQHMYSGEFDMRNTFLLRRDDLRPIQLDSEHAGSPHVHLDYSEKRILGWKMIGTTKQPISVYVTGPIWDGNLWDETFAALPLAPGVALTLPTYQYDSSLGTFYVDTLDEHNECCKHGTSRPGLTEPNRSSTPSLRVLVSELGKYSRSRPSVHRINQDSRANGLDSMTTKISSLSTSMISGKIWVWLSSITALVLTFGMVISSAASPTATGS